MGCRVAMDEMGSESGAPKFTAGVEDVDYGARHKLGDA